MQNKVTLVQLARLKEEASHANTAYDAARKAYKAQQKAQARAERLANSIATDSVHGVQHGRSGSGFYPVPRIPCVPAVLSAFEVAAGEI